MFGVHTKIISNIIFFLLILWRFWNKQNKLNGYQHILICDKYWFLDKYSSLGDKFLDTQIIKSKCKDVTIFFKKYEKLKFVLLNFWIDYYII